MKRNLAEIKEQVFCGIRAAGQGSYKRRLPPENAIRLLEAARLGLVRYMEENEPSEDIWRMLSQMEECLLHYHAARRCLERALEVSGRRAKKDLKKIALLKEYEGKWKSLILNPTQLKALGDFLEERLNVAPFDRSLKWTRLWLEENKIEHPEEVIEGIRANGAYNDFQVLANLVKG